MAFRYVSRQRRALPIAAGVLASTAILRPGDVHAEASNSNTELSDIRKPIYDDPTPPRSPTLLSRASKSQQPATTPPPSSSDVSSSPSEGSPKLATYTDQLAKQIRAARLQAYSYSLRAEDSFNGFMSRAFSLENDFTDTLASLAPPRSANEPLLPGFIYIMVGTLAGSIVTRNRGILLRTFVPVTFGVATAYAVIPVTMQNVEGLVGRYEETYPRVKQAHEQTRERIERFWETGKAHTAMTVERGEGLLDEARKKMEEWVRKGR